MRIVREKVIVLVSIYLLVSSAAATSVINTADWKEFAKAKNHADLNNESTFTVTTPTDAKIARETVDNPETFYTGDLSLFKNFQEVSGLDFYEKKYFNEINSSNISDGYIIVKDSFGTDTVSAIPYASRRDYSLLYYDKEMNISSQKPKVFYGNFDFNPENRYENSKYINGTWQQRVLNLANRTKSQWALLSPRSYVDPGALGNEPVLFKMERRKLAKVLDNSNINRLKVLGAENILYAKEVEILADKDLKILAKTGRTFTGIKGVEGVRKVKKLKTNYRRFDLSLQNVVADSTSSKAYLEFVNKGNTQRAIQGALNGKEFGLTALPFSSVTHTVKLQNASTLNITYSTDRSSKKTFAMENISYKSRSFDAEVLSSNVSEKLSVQIRNTGNETKWFMMQSEHEYDRIELQPGKKGTLQVESKNRDFDLYQGPFENQFLSSQSFKASDNIQGSVLIPVLAVSAIVLSLLVISRFRR